MIRLSTAIPVLFASLTSVGIAMGDPKPGNGHAAGGKRPPVETNGSSGGRTPVVTTDSGRHVQSGGTPSAGSNRQGPTIGGGFGQRIVQPGIRGTFKYGYYYSGRGNRFWSQVDWCTKYRCKCYWCPSTSCWYYWCNNAACYYPVCYIDVEPPTTVDDTLSD